MRKLLKTTAALFLALVLTVPVYGAEADPENTRQQDLDFLYEEVLAKHHPDLYANTPKEDFEALKAEIEGRLGTVSDTEFLLDLMRLTALAGDSHTMLSVGNAADFRAYPFALLRQGEHWYLSLVPAKDKALLGQEVTLLAGKPVEEAAKAFGTLMASDNPVHLRRQFRQACNIADIYEYLGLVEAGKPLVIGLEKGKTLSLEAMALEDANKLDFARLADQVKGSPATAATEANYWAKPLNKSTYYIQYNACMEAEDLPMEDFARNVAKDLEKGAYTRILLDLRNNGGGSDGVIWPVLNVLRGAMDDGAELVGLTGERTFSSALINAVELQEMGAVLAGEAAGGSVCHFGAVQSFRLPNSQVRGQLSSKYIDLNTLLDAGAGRGVEALAADVEVPQTLADTLAGKDTLVEWLLAHPEKLAQAEFPEAPLTRGRFLGQLFEAVEASAPDPEKELPFADSLGIEWYLPALRWAKEAGIAQGGKDGTFSAARGLTWKEAAVFLTRTAEALDLSAAPGHRSGPIPQALAALKSPAVDAAWELGLLPADANPAVPITRTQGDAMAAALAALAP